MENRWLYTLDYQLSKVKNIHSSKHDKSLSEKDNGTYDDEEPEDDEEMPEDDSEEPDDSEEGPEADLNDRQKMMYEYYEDVVENFGKFDQTAKANGAHYAPAALNPFKEEGMICGNCVYFIGGGYCEIVSGKIESNAICKLWIIPENLIKAPKKK